MSTTPPPRLDPFLDALAGGTVDGHRVAAWSVYATERRRLALGIKDRQAGNPHAPLELTELCGARSLLVWDDGLVSRGTLERRQIELDAGESLATARAAAYTDPDAAAVSPPAACPAVELHDPAVAGLAWGATEALERRLAFLRARFAQAGVGTWSGSFAATEATATLRTSLGFDETSTGTTASWHARLDGEFGDGFTGRALEPQAEFEARTERLVELVARLRGPSTSKSPAVRPVLLHPDVVEELVLDTLLDNLSGSRVAHGESAFRVEDFAARQAVLRQDLSLWIAPTEPLRSGSYCFSTEGVPAFSSTLIEAGRLVTPVLDLKYARRLGMLPTAMPYAMDTVHLGAAARLSLEEGLAAAAGGALVLDVLGVHTLDPASGDFSLSAPQMLEVAAGGLGRRMRGTIAGNLFEMLRSPELALVDLPGERTPGLLAVCHLQA